MNSILLKSRLKIMRPSSTFHNHTLLLFFGLIIGKSSFAQYIFPKEFLGKCGYVDADSAVIIPYQYDWAGYFQHSAACIKVNGKFGLIDSQGNYLLEPKFDSLVTKPYAVVFEEGSLFGIMDTLGRRISEPVFERVEGGADKTWNVKRDGHWARWKDGVEIPESLENLIFTSLDEPPKFSGCTNDLVNEEGIHCSDIKMLNFIYSNIKYPPEAREDGVSGSVYISFIIDVQGKVTQSNIEKDPGADLGKEALRVVNKMPKWTPGKVEGTLVATKFILPVRYILD